VAVPLLHTKWGKLAYTDSGGPGTGLLLLHGSGCRAADWQTTVAALTAPVRVITLDFRGHGNSDVPAEAFTLTDLADDVVRLAEHCPARRLVLVGHSLGGMVAMAAAPRLPNLAGLVLLEGWTRLAAAAALGGGRHFGHLDPTTVQSIKDKAEAVYHRVGPANWATFWRSVQQFDGYDYLQQATVPIFEVYGELGRGPTTRDRLMVPDNPHVAWSWVADAGHYLPHEKPRDVAQLCMQMIEHVERSR
jgi:pimeloyl-ACP methyl ester carboxylesterase